MTQREKAYIELAEKLEAEAKAARAREDQNFASALFLAALWLRERAENPWR